MSTENFDGLAAALPNRSVSRRRALQLAAASALGAVGLGVTATAAHAAPQCPRRGAGCCRECTNTNKSCTCIRTTAGNRRCVYQCCPENLRGCDEGRDCGGTSAA